MFFCRYVYFTNFINYKTKPNLDFPCGVDMYASARFFYCRYSCDRAGIVCDNRGLDVCTFVFFQQDRSPGD